jgi:hypothetical protein
LRVVKKCVIGSGKKAKVIEECEVDTGLLNAMADLETQVAIETGQWTEKQDVSVTASTSTVPVEPILVTLSQA